MLRRQRYLAQSLGKDLIKKVAESRVLLVGAGGIGCELLKNLVCCGFGSTSVLPPDPNRPHNPSSAEDRPQKKAEIVVIDLDTIDLSNLNRQFLFRRQHIKKAKATVAKETASQFNPSVNIDAHFASIYDTQYDTEFFQSFDIVFNALDNLAARRHVNRMCLAADVPLIESGTTGFNGQVQTIQKGVTECYDCNEKPVQKSFPICTIRSTPSQPIHCVVWAKSYLLPELFGTSEEDSSDMALTDGDQAEEVAKLKEEAEALKKIRTMVGQTGFAQEVFNKVFYDDIERLRSMTEMWHSRQAPNSLRFESVSTDVDPVKQGRALSMRDQAMWSLPDNLKVFCYAIDTLSKRVAAGEKTIEFDKDDKDTLDFVAAAANLRSHVFGIPLNSEWDIKQMAGNIIPAVATSNALTASVCVMQAFKVLRSQASKTNAYLQPSRKNSLSQKVTMTNGKANLVLGGATMTFLASKSTDRLLLSEKAVGPKAACPVCSPFYAQLFIKEGTAPNLQHVVDLLRARLNFEDFSITADAGLIYDPDLLDNLGKALPEIGIDGKRLHFVTVQDDSDEPKIDLVLTVKTKPLEEGDDLVLFPEKIVLQPKAGHTMGEKGIPVTGKPSTPEPVPDLAAGPKRKREAEAEVEQESVKKKAKPDGIEVCVVEDDGAILLD